MSRPDDLLQTVVSNAVTALTRSIRQEVHRTLYSLMIAVMLTVFLTAAGVASLIIGVLYLSDAFARLCERWLADPLFADMVVGFTFIAVPLVAILVLRLRTVHN